MAENGENRSTREETQEQIQNFNTKCATLPNEET